MYTPNKPMNFDQYQEAAAKTAIYPAHARMVYPLFGLISEVGEFAGKIKKEIRDGTELDRNELKAELGDILWYISALATDLNFTLDDIAKSNVAKLLDRQARNRLGGSGDHR